jgi:predicted small secreted protein
MRFKFVTLVLLMAAIPLSACSTVKGAGKDLESASDSVNDGLHDR